MHKLASGSTVPYTRHEVIGRGSYGIVYKGIHNTSRQTVAIKVLNLDTAEDEVCDIQKEIVLLQSLKAGDAQNVVRYHGSFLHGTRLWIIMDYCEGGSIRTLMKSGRIEERYIVIIVREVLAALNYIHKADIIHRDVKAANILVTNDGRVQLCDFGVAAQLAANHFKRNTFVGTPYWMAPEVISDGMSYNYKADIWSLGITIYEIATGNPPYADQEPMRAIFLIPRNSPTKLEGPVFSATMKEFVSACLCDKPDERPAALELLKHRWIKGSSKTSTSILRELIARYDAWRKSGGVRKSLAMGGDMDGDDDFDENFGLEEEHEADANTWDFGTLKPNQVVETLQPTWEQSADATEDLLRTIRPAAQASTPSVGSRHEHPLMKLFGHGSTEQGGPVNTQSMLDLPSRKNSIADPSTPTSEAVVIEMPELGAISLASASSVSLPALPTAPAAATSSRTVDFQNKYGPRDVRGIGLGPSRQNSFDIFGPGPQRHDSDPSTISNVAAAMNDSPSQAKYDATEDKSSPFPRSTSVNTSSPNIQMKSVSPDRSRPTSPTRKPLSSQMSPPSSPSRSLVHQQMHSTSTSISSTASLPPKSGFAAGLGLTHMQLSGSAQSLPDILPRPSISGASRDRSPSTGSVPMLPKQHVKKPSNLILQMPGLADSLDSTFLPPSPSRALNGLALSINGVAAQPYTHTPLNPDPSTPTSSAVNGHDVSRLLPSKRVTELPHLAPLDLNVLNDQDHTNVVTELTRVVGDMLVQLTHVENGLAGMTFSQ